MKTKDLIIVGAIYVLTIQIGVNINNVSKIDNLKQDAIKVQDNLMKVNDRLSDFEDMVQSLNIEIDNNNKDMQQYVYLEDLKKDLR